MPRYAVIEAPSILGLRPTGVEELPRALVEQGLVERLGARHACRVEPTGYDATRDAATLTLNPHGIAAFSRAKASASGLMSVAITWADAICAAIDTPMHPVPVPTSAMTGAAWPGLTRNH